MVVKMEKLYDTVYVQYSRVEYNNHFAPSAVSSYHLQHIHVFLTGLS